MFTTNEIDNLIEALDAWEKTDVGTHLMKSFFKSIISEKMDENGKLKMEQEEAKEREELEKLQIEKKETSLLLKAKLVQFKRNVMSGLH